MILLFTTLIIIIHFFLLSRLQFTAWPELISYPFLFTNGFELYKDFIMPYPPGLILYLSFAFSFLGFTPEALKYSFWFLVLLTDIALFTALFVQKKSMLVIFFFLVIYALFQSLLDGNMLWFDYATVFPVLISYIFVIFWIDKKKRAYLFLASIFLSLAILIKQISIVYFAGFLLFYIIQTRKINLKDLLLIGVGLFPVLFFICLILLTNSIDFFWKWTIFYPIFEWSKFPGYVALHVGENQKTILLLLFLPLVFIVFNKKILFDKKFLISLIFLFSSIIAVYPRFSFFHFQTALAFLIITFFHIAISLNKKVQAIFLLFIVLFVLIELYLLLPFDQWGGIRFFGTPEKIQANKIAKLTKPSDRIFLLGPPSSIYAGSNRLPPTNWSDNFGWYLEIPGVQEWVIEGFEKTPPKYIFFQKPQPGNWFDLGTYKPQKITDYMKKKYDKVRSLNKDIEIWMRKEK